MWDNYKSCSRQPGFALPLFITSKNTDYRRTKIRHFSSVKKCPCPLLFSLFCQAWQQQHTSLWATESLWLFFFCVWLFLLQNAWTTNGQSPVLLQLSKWSNYNWILTPLFSCFLSGSFFQGLPLVKANTYFSSSCTLFVLLHNSNELVNHSKT